MSVKILINGCNSCCWSAWHNRLLFKTLFFNLWYIQNIFPHRQKLIYHLLTWSHVFTPSLNRFVDIKSLIPPVMNMKEHCTWALAMPVKSFNISVFPSIHLNWKVDVCYYASPGCFKWFRFRKEMLNPSWKSLWGLKELHRPACPCPCSFALIFFIFTGFNPPLI